MNIDSLSNMARVACPSQFVVKLYLTGGLGNEKPGSMPATNCGDNRVERDNKCSERAERAQTPWRGRGDLYQTIACDFLFFFLEIKKNLKKSFIMIRLTESTVIDNYTLKDRNIRCMIKFEPHSRMQYAYVLY